MQILETVLNRRSIRAYTDEPVPRETIERLLAAAMSAPSAADEQPWQFIVIDDPHILENIPGVHPFTPGSGHAPAAVLICGDLSLLRTPGFWVQDCAAAAENLLLAAHGIGLGAVWMAVFPLEDRIRGFRTLFSLPDHIVPFALVPVGHPAEEVPPADRFCEDRIHYNGW